MPLIPGEAPTSKRRFPRWLAALIAIAVAVIAWIIFVNPSTDTKDDTAIGNIDYSAVPAPIEDPTSDLYVFYHNEDNRITRVTAPGGRLLFDNGWDTSDHRSPDSSLSSGYDISVNRYGINATLLTPSGSTQEGTTYLEVSVGTDKLVALVETYNAIDSLEEDYEPTPGPPTIGAHDLLRGVLNHSALSNQALIEFVTTDDSWIETNQAVAEAYAKGYSAWELFKGSPGFSYDVIYEYRFACARYGVVPGNNDQMIEQLQSILPRLDLTIAVGTERNPSPSRRIDFWDGGHALVNSDEPCAVYPVEATPSEPWVPTDDDYPEKEYPSDGVINAPDDEN